MAQRFDSPLRVLVGHGDPEGTILVFDYQPETGVLAPAGAVATGSSTSFLAQHPNGRIIYTTQNRSDQLSAFSLGGRGSGAGLTLLDRTPVPAAAGQPAAGPAYVTVDAGGRFVLAANYRGHNVVVFELRPDGRFGPLTDNVSHGEHAHLVRLTPDNRHVLVPYLGSDRVGHYHFDARAGRLTPGDPSALTTAPGAGPRHLDFHPNRRFVYLINELDATLVTCLLDPERGTLQARGTIDSLPPGYDGRRWGAHVVVSPSGRFLYVSNRAHDSLAVFALDPDSGLPSLVQRLPSGGRTPRHFCLAPDGRFLLVAHQDSGDLATFAVDPPSGRLTRQGGLTVRSAPYYVQVVRMP